MTQQNSGSKWPDVDTYDALVADDVRYRDASAALADAASRAADMATALHDAALELGYTDEQAEQLYEAAYRLVVAPTSAAVREEERRVLELLTTEQAAAQLGVSERHVRRIARERSLGWQIQDGVWLFRPGDVDAMRERAPRGRPRSARA